MSTTENRKNAVGLKQVGRLSRRLPQALRRKPFDITAARRILLVRPDEIGDMVMFTPVLRELRRNLAETHISLLARGDVKGLVQLCPYVDRLISLPREVATAPAKQAFPKLFSFSRSVLRTEKFDVAIVTRWEKDYQRAVALAWASGAPRRIGYADNLGPMQRRLGMINCGFSDLTLRHGVEKNLRLLELLGLEIRDRGPEIWWDAEDERAASSCLAPAGARPVLALGIGARHAKRRWPIERFAQLARHFIREHDGYLLIVGGVGDRPIARVLEETLGARVLNAECALSLRESAAALGRCHAMVGNDSGPIHVAAAAGTPVVNLACHPIGGDPAHVNAPEKFAPYGRHCVTIRPLAEPPCVLSCEAEDAHCIRNVGFEEVRDSLDVLLTSSLRIAARLY